ncbi:MAG: 50S ribosomal protein L22 [archaeon]
MADYKISFTDLKENMAFAVGKDLSISTKYSVEICNYLKGRKSSVAKKLLEKVITLEKAVPIKKFNRDTGHKAGIAAGRFPVNTAKAIIKIIESAEANAQNKGLGTELVIIHMRANKTAAPYHYGRQRRRKMKRCHVEVVLAEEKKVEKND